MASKYIVYGRSSCPYCRDAKSLLERKKMKFEFVDLERDPEMLSRVKSHLRWPTVPVIIERRDPETMVLVGGLFRIRG